MSEELITNPLLADVRMPGETFRLPSGGKFYKDNELGPDVKNGEVHVYPLTALDEIILKTPDKLLNGEAVSEVFKRCIPSILKPNKLFTQDVDYLMVCLRKVTFGSDIEVTYKHDCVDAKKHHYTFSVNIFLQKAKTIDAVDPKAYELVLENQQKIMIKPLRFEDYIKASQMDDTKVDTPEQIRDQINAALLNVIESVEGVTDRKFIREWLETIQTTWIRSINEAVDKASDWGPVFEVEMNCKDCGDPFTATTSLNPLSFFS